MSAGAEGVVSFGSRLAAACAAYGQLCVGIDPHAFLLEEWGLADDPAGLESFGRRVVEAAAGRVGIVKPQVAFFERHGSAGYAALERILSDARAAGLLVIADAKRGDIGTSVTAYAEAWLRPGSPLEADAMTAAAYQGLGSLEGMLTLAQNGGKGVFVLAATSNPQARPMQRALVQDGAQRGATVAGAVLSEVASWNAEYSRSSIGSVGVVLGATVTLSEYGIQTHAPVQPVLPVLAPGFGHQGAAIADVPRLFGALSGCTIVSESRSILGVGPDRIAAEIARRVTDIQESFVR
ncbi:orotidine-5'-phosphate decarboxylase [Rathayibacter toxicus]|uniref:orotidine-5'-phosphate decarboxylase n=1 Tax=Rathayibacter toxicus TaxID=145458 RepID=UPI000CE8EF72|nr:orotidine-5'-phosphate decarboxylase [Rathayibacter toxicus]PPI55426.1 orotidine-5'-phosphate decarboxylase [Rathayibacter toxicus]QOD11242.1 orotidine-5'-phosphate decarboxylase [Rathayibacter toxicus]QWL27985.1 orotidine-5'-phosphate decarboxylase [Rathayibacter toxicus]QWL32183.1 orotidine-5'-phosphate decarboxylase [Rathayibacter toxicus]QWL34276.1 orotidine-5'-phosphate decarboxylase [Rathayibacter toxicus]